MAAPNITQDPNYFWDTPGWTCQQLLAGDDEGYDAPAPEEKAPVKTAAAKTPAGK